MKRSHRFSARRQMLSAIFRHVAHAGAYLSLILSASRLYRVSSMVLGPGAFMLSLPKLLAGSLAPLLGVLGAASALGNLLASALERRSAADRANRPRTIMRVRLTPGTVLAVLAGALGAALSADYVRRVSAPHMGFDEAFGSRWQTRIPPALAARLLPKRWRWRLPTSPHPRWERDVVFGTVPGTERRLLADVWQPPAAVPRSGLAVVYLHGGGYVTFDKDMGTRPLFCHLAAQGHLVMDVSYRLLTETTIFGMVGDVKRAIAWIKHNADRFGIDPDRIVLMGGSAGGHLALLAAYTSDDALFTPADVSQENLAVCGVVSYYSAGEMRPERKVAAQRSRRAERIDELLRHVQQRWGGAQIPVEPAWSQSFLGASPAAWPKLYEQVTPITHVGPCSPPTLLVMGTHDVYIAASGAVAELHRALRAAGVPSIYVELAATDHAFDMFFPRWSPPAQAALYDLDRFLALLAAPPEDRMPAAMEDAAERAAAAVA